VPEKNNTEEVVYQAAVDLMAARGFHGTSLRDVAKAVGMQMSSLYYYFPSKQDMLVAIMRRTMEDLQAFVEPAIRSETDPVQQIRAGIKAHVLFHADRGRETIVADSEIRALEGEHCDAMIALRDRYGAMFTNVLKAGKKSGAFQFGDPHVATNALVTMCAGVATWYRPSGRMTLEAIADELASLFLDGVVSATRQPA
jgi:AcrR family transcriptional regulator